MRLTEAEREAAFQRYLASTVNYFEAIEATGDEPWHKGDLEARRELFYRRYTRPEPPASMPALTLAEVRGTYARG
ncbi:hypothetical protein [Mycobacterium sp. URHB0021]|jgi:hypothetical protein